MRFESQVIKDGAKNFSLMVKGIVTHNFVITPIIDLDKVQSPRENWKGLRLDSAIWLIEEKMGLHLWWESEQTEKSLIFPMESRNSVRFDEGIPSPRVADGWSKKLYLSSYNVDLPPLQSTKSFFILLDFDKQ